MSGKGDTLRPAAVPGQTVRDAWDRTFGPPRLRLRITDRETGEVLYTDDPPPPPPSDDRTG
jgi:hypothetical protein